MRALLVAVALAQLADVLSTNHALATNRPLREYNPVMQLCITYLGAVWWFPKAALAAFFMFMALTMSRVTERQVMLASVVTTVYIVVVVSNLLH